MRTIKLSVQQAKSLHEKDNSFRDTLLSEFTDVELGIKPKLKSWKQLCSIGGYWLNGVGTITHQKYLVSCVDAHKVIFATEKQALSALAMAQLSQLMADLGDECDVDWGNSSQLKYTIIATCNTVEMGRTVHLKRFIAFKTEEVREAFLEKHAELINQYFMI